MDAQVDCMMFVRALDKQWPVLERERTEFHHPHSVSPSMFVIVDDYYPLVLMVI
jgi:hypothetical protein